ncbi:unnamed protein product [Polarella glacialis]|nr:unnamed protein product [Polarella glacialis]
MSTMRTLVSEPQTSIELQTAVLTASQQKHCHCHSCTTTAGLGTCATRVPDLQMRRQNLTDQPTEHDRQLHNELTELCFGLRPGGSEFTLGRLHHRDRTALEVNSIGSYDNSFVFTYI